MKSSQHYSQFSLKLAKSLQSTELSGKYKGHESHVGCKVWTNITWFTRLLWKFRASQKLSLKQIGPIFVINLVDQTSVLLEPPVPFMIGLVFQVISTNLYVYRPKDISHSVSTRPRHESMARVKEQLIEKILDYRKRVRVNHVLTLTKGDPDHDATCQSARILLVSDGTLTEDWHNYMVQKKFQDGYH